MNSLIEKRLEILRTQAPDSIGNLLDLRLIEAGEDTYTFRGKTEYWMRNVAGTLHGGMGATLADHAMGTIVWCLLREGATSATTALDLKYHRPLIPGEDVRIRVCLVSKTKSLIHLSAELYRDSVPEKLCISASATFFVKNNA